MIYNVWTVFGGIMMYKVDKAFNLAILITIVKLHVRSHQGNSIQEWTVIDYPRLSQTITNEWTNGQILLDIKLLLQLKSLKYFEDFIQKDSEKLIWKDISFGL